MLILVTHVRSALGQLDAGGIDVGLLHHPQAGVKGESGGSVGGTAGKKRSASRAPQTVGT